VVVEAVGHGEEFILTRESKHFLEYDVIPEPGLKPVEGSHDRTPPGCCKEGSVNGCSLKDPSFCIDASEVVASLAAASPLLRMTLRS
jgi:hypothetical protein